MDNKEYYVYIIEQYSDTYYKPKFIDKTDNKQIALDILNRTQKQYDLRGYVQEYSI